MAMGGSARGSPYRDPTLSGGVAETKTGQWVRVGRTFNIYIRTAGTWSGTVNMDVSFDGVSAASGAAVTGATLTVDDADANIFVDKPYPFVRVRISAYSTGRVEEVFIASD